MKIHHKLSIVAILGFGALVPVTSSEAGRISIEIGDRPYYTRGPSYWERGSQWVWVPGHWSRGRQHWVRGRYVRRGGDGLRGRALRRHRLHRDSSIFR
ncbi:MAG: hypothetical protein H0U88_06660 [Chthoniobacterales bacterium]|nr:hypothetical protein [Chthoniobacterales bacterium]